MVIKMNTKIKTFMLLVMVVIGVISGCISIGEEKPAPKINIEKPIEKIWGRIANPSHKDEIVYTALFFSGASLGLQHESLYTRHPLDQSYLKWGEENASKQIGKMKELGLNTIKVSYWNPQGIYSPMKSDLKAIHDTFEIAEKFDLLVVPFVEDNYHPSDYMFWTHFPQDTSKFEEKLVFLLNEFGKHENWLKMYNKDGEEKIVFWLIDSVASRPVNEKEFAETFDKVAQRVKEKTGEEIGFVIDFTATGPYAAEHGINTDYLEQQESILAFNPFNPFNEGKGKKFGETPTERQRVDLVIEKYSKVIDSKIPIIYSVIAGFDDTKLNWRVYREEYGYYEGWLSCQEELAARFGEGGLSFDCWNGYTEGFVIVPTKEDGTKIFEWAKELIEKYKHWMTDPESKIYNKTICPNLVELLEIEKTQPSILKQSPLTLKKEDFKQLSPWQKYVTPKDSEVQRLVKGISTEDEAYATAVKWLWVSDQTLNGKRELWLMPHEFLTNTPGYLTNPVQGMIASDCEEQAYTLVSLLRAIGISAEDVRVVVGEANFGDETTGHAWIEIYENGKWFALDATSGSYWNDDDNTLYDRAGYPYRYFKTHTYPSIEIWAYFNDIYYYNPSTGDINAPDHWRVHLLKT